MSLGTDHDPSWGDHADAASVARALGDVDWPLLVDQLPDRFDLFDVEGNLVYGNAGAAGSAEARPDLTDQVRQVIATGVPEHVENSWTAGTGDERVELVDIRPVRARDGETVGAIAIGRDVTCLLAAHRAAAEREHEFHTLAENLPDIILRYDLDGRVTYVNHRLGDEVNADAGSLIGRRPTEYVPEGMEGVDEYERVLMQVIRTGEAAEAYLTVVNPAGERRTHAVLFRVERSSLGEIVGAVAIGRDITDLEEIRAETARREVEFRTLAENLPDVVIRYDADGRVTYVNSRLEDRVDVPDDFVGKRPSERQLQGHDGMAEYERVLMRVLATGEPGSAEIRHTLPGGEVTVHLALIRAERNRDGDVVGAISIGRDITELERAHEQIARREYEFRSLAEHLPDAVIRFDLDGRATYANSSARRPNGVASGEVLGVRPCDFTAVGVSGLGDYDEMLQRVLRSGEPGSVELRYDHGVVESIELRAERDAAGRIVGAIAIGRDITEIERANAEIALREREFRSLAENAQDFIGRWDADGGCLFVNPALARLYDAEGEARVREQRAEFDGDPFAAVTEAIDEVIRTQRPKVVQQQFIDRLSGLQTIHDIRLMPEFCADGHLVSVLGIGRDVTEVLHQRDALERAASTDPLTGVASRNVLYQQLPELLARRSHDGTGGAVLLVDLDGFKTINDQFGHRLGDRLLQDIARRLTSLLGPDDLLVRLGGDEFAFVLAHADAATDASLLAYRVRNLITDVTAVDDTRVSGLDACVGIAFFPEDGRKVDDVLAHADLALYEAKRRGRGRVEYFRRDLRQAMERRATLEQALRSCDPDVEMSLHLQPICRLGSEPGVWGVEALLRWEHPTLGPLAPDEFIPIAEQSGEIIPIGRWVMQRAAELAVRFNQGRSDPLRFAVNVSSRQLTPGDIHDALLDVVRETGCDPSWLTIELTESLLLEDLPQVNHSLEMLHALGVSLAIDDFGTGYSALQYLSRLDIDYVKIDKSFVQESDVDLQRREIVRAIVALADALGIGTVAEGIETNSQADFLRELSCGLGQGYLLARPMPEERFEEWLGTADARLEAVLGG